jgi:arginine-tRNA-protein transferase
MHEEAVIYRGEFPCPYFNDGRIGTHEYVVIGWRESGGVEEYLRRGYRRIGTYYYKPVCRECFACMPIRLETSRFMPNRSQLILK